MNKLGITSDYDLKVICANNNIQLDAVVMKDQLKNIPKKSSYSIICNLQSSSRGNGTHWVAIYKKDKNSDVLYYDSFGGMPPKEVLKYKMKTRMEYSNFITQHIDSDECGMFCIAFLHYLQKNTGDITENYNDFINIFLHETIKNDNQLYKYLKFSKININV